MEIKLGEGDGYQAAHKLDEYLDIDANLTRLLAEYKKYGSLTIGVDFDGTLHDYHKTGATHERVRQLVRDLHFIGCTIVIWTAYRDLDYVSNFLIDIKVPFDYINEGGIPLPWDSKKPFFSSLLDDRAGLLSAYTDLKTLVAIVKKDSIDDRV